MIHLSQPSNQDPVLAARNLQVDFYGEHGMVHAVQDVSWVVNRGETLGIVGESGSGKTATALSIMDLIPTTGRLAGGEFSWHGEPISHKALGRMRGSRISMVFQDPISSLNPLVPVGRQITEVLRKYKGLSRKAARERAIELLELVGVSDPNRRVRQYPFEFSGGMAQRVMIAMALAPEPDLLIADEPTTALDVTIQAQILDLIDALQLRLGIALILITHDLGVVASVADRIVVMYAGRVVEEGPTVEIFKHPSHPYTAGLLASTPNPHNTHGSLVPIKGSPPMVAEVLSFCAFADRCNYASAVCLETRPNLEPTRSHPNGHRKVACWHEL